MRSNWFENLDPAVRRMLIIPRGQIPRARPAPGPARKIPDPPAAAAAKFTRRSRRVRTRRVIHRRPLSALEIKHLEKIPEKHGIGRTFDFRAHLDKSLTYQEAKTEITRKVREVSRPQLPGISQRSFIGDLERHLEDLKFKASAGSAKARIELEHWKKERR